MFDNSSGHTTCCYGNLLVLVEDQDTEFLASVRKCGVACAEYLGEGAVETGEGKGRGRGRQGRRKRGKEKEERRGKRERRGRGHTKKRGSVSYEAHTLILVVNLAN